jgi:hypothetical protein
MNHGTHGTHENKHALDLACLEVKRELVCARQRVKISAAIEILSCHFVCFVVPTILSE